MKSEVVYCWNCKTAMTIEGNYYKCSRCGATWNELPSLDGTYIDVAPARGRMSKAKISKPVRRRRSTIKR